MPVSLKVRVEPSRRKFPVDGRETILEAGLRAGLNLPYGCATGNCGKCAAQLISGVLKKSRHHDFHFSEAEKARGMFLTCSHVPRTDLEINVDLTANVRDIPHQEILAKVKKVNFLTDQVAALQVRLARVDKLQFLAGQSVRLGGADDMPGAVHHIASCPCNSVNLFFHIPYLPGDPFSELVFKNELAPGDHIQIRGPYGDFVLFEDLKAVPDAKVRDDEFTLPPLIFICWHTGFAPVRSLIEHVMSFETESPVYLYRLSPVPGDHYLHNLCRSWDDALDNMEYHPLPDRFTLMSSREEADAILSAIIAQHPDLKDSEVYVAGPDNLVESAKALFPASGLTPENLKTEKVCLGMCG